MHRQLLSVLILGLIGLPFSVSSAPQTLTHPAPADEKDQLIVAILQLALTKSGQAHAYDLQTNPAIEASSTADAITSGNVDITWANAQYEQHAHMSPIRIPILKGLLGHRIFLIREGEQDRFNTIDSLEELKRIPLGQARFYNDTDILKQANMNVIDPVKHESLFKMLEGGRFEFFPRAVHEPWQEISAHQDLPLTIEENILLVYPYALYFYVGANNAELQATIETGFRAAIEDGSFDQLFFSHPLVKTALEKSRFASRKVFRIDNPHISANDYREQSELWLNVESL